MQLQLKRIRKENGMSQAELADHLGIDIKTIGNWERGKTIPNVEQIWNCAVALGSTPNDLMGWYIDHPQEVTQHMDSDPDFDRLARNYRALGPEGRAALVATSDALAERLPAASAKHSGNVSGGGVRP